MDSVPWGGSGTAAITTSSSYMFSSPFQTKSSSAKYSFSSAADLFSSEISSPPSHSLSTSWNDETGESIGSNKSMDNMSNLMKKVGSTLQGILNGTSQYGFDPELSISNLTSLTTISTTDPATITYSLSTDLAINNSSIILSTSNTTSVGGGQPSFPGKNVIIPLYTLIFFLSFLGNLMVILTLARNRRMRTVTNVLLLNLAVSDLLLGVFCMPVTLIGQLRRSFIFGAAMCRILPYFQAVSVSVGVWTLVAISLERYFAICRPLQSRKWQTRSHAYKMIVAVWLFTLSWNLPIMFVSTLQPIRDSGRYKCREIWPSRESEKIFNLVLDFLLLVIPLCIMGLAYSLIVSKLWKGLQSEIRHTRSFRHHGARGHLIPRDDSLELSTHSHFSTCKLCTNETGATSTTARMCGSTTRECVSNVVTLKGGKGVVVRWHRKSAIEIGDMGEGSSNHRMNGGQQQRPKCEHHQHHHHHHCSANHCSQNLTNQNCQCQKPRQHGKQQHQQSIQQQESNMVRAIRSTYTGKSMESKKKVIRMLFVLVAEFFVCWTPLYVMNTWYLFDPDTVYNRIGPFGIVLIQLLAYVSSCCNPITYCFMNRKFRQAFIKVFQCTRARTVTKTGPQTLGRGSDVSANDSLVYGAAPSTLNKSVLVLECENRV